MLSDTCHLVVG